MRFHSRSVLCCAAIVAALACALPPLDAQGSGKITGIATDNSGAAIAGAAVTATNVSTGAVWRTGTNTAGVYLLSPLPVGMFTVRAEKPGFKVISIADVRLDVDAAVTLDLHFALGDVSQNVTVQASVSEVGTESSSVTSSRYVQQVQNLPLPVREVIQFAYESPGVSYGLQGEASGNYTPAVPGSGSWTPWQVVTDGAEGNMNGLYNNWTGIDGMARRADLNSPNVDAVEEVHFTTTGADAEHSQPTLAIVASKSGTNQIHGSAFEYYQSGGLDALRWGASSKLSYVRHQAGGTVGGPIKKDKMFFFGGYELYRFTGSEGFFGRWPTGAERSGDLSELLTRTNAQGAPAPITIFDPLSSTHAPFPGDIIPANRISPVSSQLLQLIPAAPLAGNLTNFNAQYAKPLKDDSDKYDLRYDYNISDKDHFFARTTFAHLDQAYRYSGNLPGTYGGDAKIQWSSLSSMNYTHIFNASTVASVELAFRSMPFYNTPTDGQTQFGVPIAGLNPTSPYAGPPAIAIGSNGAGIGAPVSDATSTQGTFSGLFDRLLFNYQADYNYEIDPNITKTIGNHEIKAGFQFRRDYTSEQLAGRPYGRYTTASDFNNSGSTISATGDAYADFLLGYPSTTDVTLGTPGGWVTSSNYGAFLQDDWKITPKLTLNLGLRYDYFGFFTATHGRGAEANFQTGKILIEDGAQANIQSAFAGYSSLFETASQAGLPNSFVKPNDFDFSPRLGFAYRFGPRWVMRGAFGIYTVDDAGYIYFTDLNNPPIVLHALLSRQLLLSQGINVNSLYTFQNPTAGVASADALSLLSSTGGYSPNYPYQREYTWNYTIERDLGHSMTARGSYVANLGRNIPRTVDLNACPPGSTDCLSRPAGSATARAYSQFGLGIGAQTTDGMSNYQSLELDLTRRFAKGMLFDVNYTWSKLLALVPTSTNPVAAPTWSYDWGPAAYAPPRVVHFNYVYELPFGKGRSFATHMPAIAEGALGGWAFSGLFVWQSGYGLTPTAAGESPTDATTNRPNCVGDPIVSHSGSRGQNAAEWFNTSAFALPAFVNSSAAQPVRQFGSCGVGVIPGPNFSELDIDLTKTFPIGEKANFNLRVQLLNPMNIPMLGLPDLEVTDSTFGQIRTSNPNYNPRTLEISGRIRF